MNTISGLNINIKKYFAVMASIASFIALFFIYCGAGDAPAHKMLSEKKYIAIGVAIIVLVIMFVMYVYKKFTLKKNTVMKEKIVQAYMDEPYITPSKQAAQQAIKNTIIDALMSMQTKKWLIYLRLSKNIYKLPWILIMGKENSGKMQLLSQAGVDFPTLSQESIIERAKNSIQALEPWFSDKGIFVNIPQNYLEEEIATAWFSTLQCLKWFRTRRPINSLIYVFSLKDILYNPKIVAQEMLTMRQKMHELSKKINKYIPLYVICNHMEILPGFEALFKNAQPNEMNQAFGINLSSLHPKNYLQTCEQELNNMAIKLNNVLIKSLELESGNNNKFNMLSFIEAFKQHKTAMQDFLKLLLKDHPFHNLPNYQGIYFTGLLNNKQYFAKNVVEYISKHAVMATISSKPYSIKSLSMIAVITVGLMLWLGVACKQNLQILHQGWQLLETVKKEPNNRQAILELYDYYLLTKKYTANTPLRYGLSLYQGKKVLPLIKNYLLSQTQATYIMPFIKAHEGLLKNYSEQWHAGNEGSRQNIREKYYKTLKYYLSFFYNKELSINELKDDIFIDDSHLSRREIQLLSFYFSNSDATQDLCKKFTINAELINKSREQLMLLPLDVQGYFTLLKAKFMQIQHAESGGGEYKYIPLELSKLIQVTNKVASFYCYANWKNTIQVLIKKISAQNPYDDWVFTASFGDKKLAQALKNTISAQKFSMDIEKTLTLLYWQNYGKHWLDFIKGLNLRPFTSVEDCAFKLAHFVESTSEVTQLINFIKENCTHLPLDINNPDIKALITFFSEKANKIEPTMVQQYYGIINKVQVVVANLLAQADPGEAAMQLLKNMLTGQHQNELTNAIIELQVLSKNTQGTVASKIIHEWLKKPIIETMEIIQASSLQCLQKKWDTQVVSFFDQHLKNAFPFADTEKEVALSSFEEFLKPETGIVESFFKHYVEPFVINNRNGLHAKAIAGVTLKYKPDFLKHIHTIKTLSKMFFNNNQTLHFTMQLYPEPNPAISSMIIKNNDVSYQYRNEPEEWINFEWPGTAILQGASLVTKFHPSNAEAKIQYQGVWGLFRLLKQANLSPYANYQNYKGQWEVVASTTESTRVNFILKTNTSLIDLQQLLREGYDLPRYVTEVPY